MTRKLRIFLFTILMMIFLSPIAAPGVLAGGWAIVTLDSLPVQPRAGATIPLGFMVRQHGVTPISDSLKPYLTAQNLDTGDSLRVDARQEGPVGHFVLNVVFPSAGTWDWKIVPDPFPAIPNRLEPLVVLPAPVAGAGPHHDARDSLPEPAWLGVVAAISVAGLGLYLSRHGPRQKMGVIMGIFMLLALPTAFLLWPWAIPDVAGSAQERSTQDTDYGRALYVAKGCPACHMHRGISNSVPGPVIGPNLTSYQPEPVFTQRWLRDPQAVRPDTRMPDLDLNDAEVEALITFLTVGTDG